MCYLLTFFGKKLSREYEDMQSERSGRRRAREPQLPDFVYWLRDKVQAILDSRAPIDADLAMLSDLPSIEADEYPSIWAYGNHYRCLPKEDSIPHETFDSSVFVMSPQGCRASTQDRNIVDAELPYIGILKRVIVVTYCIRRLNIMKCSWIRPNLARNPSIRQDEHGFWLVKYDCRQDPMRDNPYVFPYSVSQVR